MFSASHSVAEATAFLSTRFESVTEVAPLGRGEWSQAFSFRAGDRQLVARFGEYVEDYRKDEVAARYAAPGLPIPIVVEIGEALDAHYAVSVRLPGDPLDHLDAVGLAAALPSIFRLLDAMRVADVSDTRGYGPWTAEGDGSFGSWREYLLAVREDSLSSRSGRWLRVLEGRPGDLAVFEEGFGYLEALVPALPEVRQLVHSDIVGDNVRLLDGEVLAVVDWGNAIYGDFLYDLARLTFWVPWYPAWKSVDLVAAARAHYQAIGLDVPVFEERLRACQIHIGLDAQAYNALTEPWDELVRSGQRTLELAEA